eukprot:6366283-Prymnesium_polylepis.1
MPAFQAFSPSCASNAPPEPQVHRVRSPTPLDFLLRASSTRPREKQIDSMRDRRRASRQSLSKGR